MPRWKKLGQIFHLEPSGQRSGTHAQGPVAHVLPQCVRVYFAARNEGKSYPAYIDLARDDLTRILKVHEQPVMTPGAPGSFDDDGIMPACVLQHEDGLWMYYTGWNSRNGTYQNATGVAVSHDGGESFVRKYEGPVMDRTPEEPYIAVTPFVLHEGNKWHAWYSSGLGWTRINDKHEPLYVIKYASSSDGIRWKRDNTLCIAQHHALEAINRPTVLKHEGRYHMWYCFRGSHDYRDGKGSYRIGYASSADGIGWERKDEAAGIALSESGWDSTMQCYPYVLAIDGKVYMFYNGNGFGQAGIGLAMLEQW